MFRKRFIILQTAFDELDRSHLDRYKQKGLFRLSNHASISSRSL